MSKAWRVQLSPDADKTYRKLPADLRRRILSKLRELKNDPRPRGCRKLVGYEELYRLRVGSWRIIYSVFDDEVLVVVIEITPHGDAYRNL